MPQQQLSSDDDESASHASAKLLAVWRRRRMLALACLVVPLSATVAAAVFVPNRYRSVALVEVAHEAPAGDAAAAVEGQLQRLNEENLSRSHLGELITRYDLYPAFRRKSSMEAAIDQMRRDIQIEIKDAEHQWGRSTVAFQVSFRGNEAAQVAQVTNALVAFYVDKSQEQRALQSTSAVAELKAQVAAAKSRLDAQELGVNEFISQHLQELPDQVRLNLATLDRLNTQLAINRNNRSRALNPREATAQPQGASRLDGADIQMARLGDQLNELRGRATDQHPDVVHLKAEIAALAASSASHRMQIFSSPAAPPEEPRLAELRSLENEKQVLNRSIAATELNVYNAPKREQELRTLLAPYETTRQLYASLVGRLDDARLQGSEQLTHALDPFRVLDPAVVARESTGPDRLRIFAVGLFLSILLALGAALLAEKLDTSFHSLDELRAFTRVPVLATVPNIIAPRDLTRLRRRMLAVALLLLLAASASAAGTYAYVHDNEPLVWMLTRGHA